MTANFITQAELAEVLGVSKMAVTHMVKSGQLPKPVCRTDKIVLFKKSDLRHLLESGDEGK